MAVAVLHLVGQVVGDDRIGQLVSLRSVCGQGVKLIIGTLMVCNFCAAAAAHGWMSNCALRATMADGAEHSGEGLGTS